MGTFRTAFGITADTGIFGAQALALGRSIRETHPDSEIIVFIPRNDQPTVSEDLLEELRKIGTVEYGPYPHSEYPVTSKLRAFELAAERPGITRAVMVDTDVLFTNQLTWPDETADLAVRPCTLRGSFWSRKESIPVWEWLYEKYDVENPKKPMSAVLGGEIPFPFYNSGVVIAQDLTIPEKLLETTLKIYEEAREPVRERIGSVTPLFYSDQVALALLAQSVSLELMPLRNNFPVPAYLRTPQSIAALHYGDRNILATALNEAEWEKYGDLLELNDSNMNWSNRLISVAWFHLANRLPYSTQTAIRRLANSRHAP